MTIKAIELKNRTVLKLSGGDTRSFIQGLITNDIDAFKAGEGLYAALLTPQGKFLFDMIITVETDDSLLLDIERDGKDDLLRRLTMYRLRADVEITDLSDSHSVWALDGVPEGLDDTHFPDPRNADLGYRLITETPPALDEWALSDYETKRLILGVPDGSRDIMPEKYFWLETNAEALNGVSFTKGCFVGQELTARMKHRTNLKKLLLPISADADIPADTPITNADGKTIGQVHTSAGNHALAYLRLEYLDNGGPLYAGDTEIRAAK
jgi:folate-binding protein YgfZ